MTKEDALKIWDDVFGNTKWAMDCFGTYMYRDDYGDTETMRIRPDGDGKKYSYGWEIDHIRPKSNFSNESEANIMNNYEPMHWINNRDKADNYPHFEIEGKQYKIVRCDICSSNGLLGYGIKDENGNRIDWKGRINKCYKNNENENRY